MKQLFFCFLMISSFVLFSQPEEKNEINTFLDQWHLDATNVDYEGYFDKIDEEGIFIGTDATEVWTKQAFYDWAEPQFTDGGKAWDFKRIERNIYFGDDPEYAWFDELLSFSGGTLRGSGVLVKRESEWKIAHYVLSLPVPNEKFRDVLEAMKDDDKE